MKKHYYIAFFAIICLQSSINAITNVYIKNQYRKPIVLNLDNVDRKVLQTNDQERLTHWPKQIKIKVLNSPSYHSGIQKELQKVWDASKIATQNNQNLMATITILDANNPFFFYYNTAMQTSAQPNAPISPPSHPSAPKPMALEQQVFTLISNKKLMPQLHENLWKLTNHLIQKIQTDKYYGQDFSDKVTTILKAKNYFGSTTPKNIAFEFTQDLCRRLLEGTEINFGRRDINNPEDVQKVTKEAIDRWHQMVTSKWR